MIADETDGFGPGGAERLLADAARANYGGRKRLAALVDLFLPDEMRLTDYQRVTVRRFIARLVAAIEHDLRRRLLEGDVAGFRPELLAALASARLSLALPVLERARALRDVELVSLLLARVEEQRLANRVRVGGESGRLVEALLADEDARVSGAAMALLIAESRRGFIFDEPVLPRTDLPAELQYRMVWWVAAALRDYMIRLHGVDHARADAAIVEAANASLAGYDEGETLESAALLLAHVVAERGWLDDQVLVAACSEGRLALFVALIAARGGIEFEAARGLALPPFGDRLIVLLRALGIARDATAAILLALGESDAGLEDQLDAFDALTEARAIEIVRPWRVGGGYRMAIAALAAGLAERGEGWAA